MDNIKAQLCNVGRHGDWLKVSVDQFGNIDSEPYIILII